VCIFTSEIENYSRSRQPYLGITVYIGKHKTEFKHLKTPGTWRMDFSELKNGSSRAAAYNEKSGAQVCDCMALGTQCMHHKGDCFRGSGTPATPLILAFAHTM